LISQYGVLPYRMDEEGKPEILLITSRERRRWVVPKGNPIPLLRSYETAAREAFEEAGIEGPIAAEPIGSFRYMKRRRSGEEVPALVTLFPMRVTRQAKRWPEKGLRASQWFSPEAAADAVEEEELKVIILSLNGRTEALYPRTSLVIMGVNRFSWGYRMLKLIRKLMPREDRFFDLFERHAQILVAGADALERMVSGAEPIPSSCQAIERHENAADDVTREVLLSVRRSFITPFDRSAITALTSSMDTAIDEMWQTAKAITLYEVTAFQPQMAEMGKLSSQAARLVLEAIPLMRNVGRNGARLHEITEAVVHLEGQADGLHDAGLRALIAGGAKKDPMSFIVNREVYRHLERVLDSFEDVADEISGIVIDHA
jgi:uncharacterized protein